MRYPSICRVARQTRNVNQFCDVDCSLNVYEFVDTTKPCDEVKFVSRYNYKVKLLTQAKNFLSNLKETQNYGIHDIRAIFLLELRNQKHSAFGDFEQCVLTQ